MRILVHSIMVCFLATNAFGQPPQGTNPNDPFRPPLDPLSLKLDALKAYDSEMRPWPHSRSIKAVEHLARWRGASVGLDAAEAFVTVRELI